MPGPPQATPSIIRSVTKALIQIVKNAVLPVAPSATVDAAPPEVVSRTASGQIVAIYLYRVAESPELKNQGPTFENVGGPGSQQVLVRSDPLTLNLHYLLIPFSYADMSYVETYELLGLAAKSLHDNAIFSPAALGVDVDPTEVELQFRVTMEPLTTTELSAIWEAVHEPYRLSVSYVVRTVQIQAGESETTGRVTSRNVVATQGPPPVAIPPPPPTVSIAGVVTIGGTLTATETGFVTSRQWQRGSVVDGIGTYSPCGGSDSGPTYSPVAADIGFAITCLTTGPGGETRSNMLRWAITDVSNYAADLNADDGVERSAGVPAGDGDTVEFWRSLVDSSGDASQPTAALRGTYRTSGGPNGHAALEFKPNSTPEGTSMVTSALGLGQGVSIFAVAQKPANGRYIFDGSTLNSRACLNLSGGMSIYSGTLLTGSGSETPGDWIVMATVFDGASGNGKLNVNGGSDTSGTIGTDHSTDLTIAEPGTYTVPIYNLDARIARLVVFKSLISDAERADVNAYLAAWAGL